MPEPSQLAHLIATRRKQLGLSLRDLERLAGVDRGNLSALESGRRQRLSPKMLARLAPVLRLSLADLNLATGYPVHDLPSIQPYLRAAYGLDESGAADVARYLHDRYGPSAAPRNGEDELPG